MSDRLDEIIARASNTEDKYTAKQIAGDMAWLVIQVQRLREENARLRAVADAARSITHRSEELHRALAELDAWEQERGR